MRLAAFLTALSVAGCAAPETARQNGPTLDLPPMKAVSAAPPQRPQIANAEIARDFLALAFQLENGDRLPAFSRFEGDITVEVKGIEPPTLTRDLDRLLSRLRAEARIPIRRTDGPGSIVVETVTRRTLQRAVPTAACFVKPNVTSWEDYRANRNAPALRWRELRQRRQMAVFLPHDVSPQEIRDCLHEEIAQALGPANDLFRLSDSIFNDDNVRTVLTGYDMLILRTFYEGTLKTGMTQIEVMARLPDILFRLNPGGGRQGIAPPIPVNRSWRRSISEATDSRNSSQRRLAAARRAVVQARSAGEFSMELAFSHFLLGSVATEVEPETAFNAYLKAGRIYQLRNDTAAHEAHTAVRIAAFLLSSGQADIAVAVIDANIDAARRDGHATNVALMMLIKAEALAARGSRAEAERTKRDALAWARYGLASDAEIRERAAEILALAPDLPTGDPS